jgi:uncharacterized protein YlbG (UPF0298 family)
MKLPSDKSYLLTYTYVFHPDHPTNHSHTYTNKEDAIQTVKQVKQSKQAKNIRLFEVKHIEIDIDA